MKAIHLTLRALEGLRRMKLEESIKAECETFCRVRDCLVMSCLHTCLCMKLFIKHGTRFKKLTIVRHAAIKGFKFFASPLVNIIINLDISYELSPVQLSRSRKILLSITFHVRKYRHFLRLHSRNSVILSNEFLSSHPALRLVTAGNY